MELNSNIGNYILLEEFDSSARSRVFKACHSISNKVIAIKLSEALTEESTKSLSINIKFFLNALHQIEHKNICKLIDVGIVKENGNSFFYQKSEFINGQKLDIWLQGKGLIERLKIVEQLIEAIDFAHNYTFYDNYGRGSKGVYHGDLNPSNLFVDQNDTLKVIDFLDAYLSVKENNKQSAYAVENNKSIQKKQEPLTNARNYENFMSPEQANNAIINEKTDIYSIGRIIDYIFTDVNQNQLKKRINKIILKATNKNPSYRYDTVSHLKNEYQKVLNYNEISKNRFLILSFISIALVTFLLFQKYKMHPLQNSRGATLISDLVLDHTSSIELNSDENKYFALLVANERYKYWTPLNNPIKDVKKMEKILHEKYKFSKENTKIIENADRETLLNALDSLVIKINSKFNLLIYYAGHGYYDSQLDQGYWIPVDSRVNQRSYWISNNTLKEYIHAIKSQHTLLISDACFSGSLIINRDIPSTSEDLRILFKWPSRRAMTSGNDDEVVPDVSVFSQQLINYLDTTELKYFSSSQLFHSIHGNIISSSKKTPQYGNIQVPDHKGGDFIFSKK